MQLKKESNCIYLNEYISIATKDTLLDISKKSVFFIKFKKTIKRITKEKKIEKIIKWSGGTGFFIKLPIPSKERPMYGLMTNNHVLDSNYIKPGKSFIIVINENQYIITLDKKNFIFTSKLIDVTFIQLTDDNFINNPKFKFLVPYFENNNYYYNNIDAINDDENQYIYIFQYPNRELSFDNGIILHKSGFNYFHNVSTDQGSSGSPLLNDDLKVIGIHKSGYSNINIATNINIIYYAIRFLYIKNYINKIKKARKMTRKLNEDELNELNMYGLKKINESKLSVEELLNLKQLELEEGVNISAKQILQLENIGSEELNMYTCSYYKYPSLKLLFYRTNHAWYFTSVRVEDISYDVFKIRTYEWVIINPYKSIEEIINQSFFILEHQHVHIIMWLKLSELKYM